MSFIYTPAKAKLISGQIDLDADDIRVALLKTKGNTTADTETNAEFVASITTLGEIVATNYTRKALTGKVVIADLANLLGKFDADDVVWTALGGATNDTIGAILLFKQVTNDADSPVIAYIDNNGTDFNLTTNGGDVTIQWNAGGILQAT